MVQAKAERPLSVQSTDLRGDAGQWARGADTGRRRDDDGAAGFDPTATLAARVRGVRYLIRQRTLACRGKKSDVLLRVFGCLPDTGVSERTEAGVRKASGEETAGEWSPAVVSAYGDWAPVFDLIGGIRTRAPAAPVARCLRLVAAGGIGTTMSRRAICVLAVGVGADGCDRRSVAVAGGIPA
jgi:hypothetical protein